MITGQARQELKKILKFSNSKDLKIIELKIVPGKPKSKTSKESIEAIVTCADQPSDVLRQQRLRKSVLRRYLWGFCIAVTQEQSKEDYIRVCLEMWQVKDDDYLWKFRTEDEIDAELDRFQENMGESLCELKRRVREKKPSPNELKSMKRSMDNVLSTIRSVGTASPMSSPSAKVTKLSLSSSSPSDNDSDSSSSSSSVKIIEPSESSSSLAYSSEFPSSQLPFVRNIFGPSSSQTPSSMNNSEPPSPQLQNSANIPETSSSQANISQPSSSQVNISKSSSSSSSNPVLDAQGTSRSERVAKSTPLDAVGTPSSGTSSNRNSANTPETPASSDAKQLTQTLLQNYFKFPGSAKSTRTSWRQ